MFKIPFSLLPPKAIEKNSHVLIGVGSFMRRFFPSLKLRLRQAGLKYTDKQYLSMCVYSNMFSFGFFWFIITLILLGAKGDDVLIVGTSATFFIILFAFIQQLGYPKMLVNNRVKSLEKNLLPALQNVLVQLNSGVPLFNTLVNISREDYGEVSSEFKRIVEQINAGKPQVQALEDLVVVNPSIFFRRAIWQIINGMKSGANLNSVIAETISLLGEEQILQIQRYGSQLNPLAMFYMLAVVIAPSLGMTFMIILSSFISLPESITKMMFWVVYGFITFFQIMFLGIIKSKRPNLLGDA